MIEHNINLMISSVGYIVGVIAEWRLLAQLQNVSSTSSEEDKLQKYAMFLKSIERLGDSAASLGMLAATKISKDAFDYYRDEFENGTWPTGINLTRWIYPADRLVHTYAAEIESHRFFTIEAKYQRFKADLEEQFDKSILVSFPSTNVDLSEACRCCSVGIWTASVMHLMRALEVALRCLSASYDIPHRENWNSSLNEIEKHLRTVRKGSDGDDAELWASATGTHFRFLKNAFRNQAMHPSKHYTETEAIELFDATRAFMRHLATRLAE